MLVTTTAFGQMRDPNDPVKEEDVRELAATGKESEILNESSTLIQQGYLFYAEILVDRLLELDPENSNYHYRKGFLLLEIRKDYEGAIPYFQNAALDVSVNADMYSHRETSSPPDVFYHLATCYHLNEEIDKALEQYENFKLNTHPKSELIPVVELRVKQCQVAKKAMASPVNVYLKNVGNGVNSKYPEYSPVISMDGSALYFTSRRPWDNDETEIYRDLASNQYPEDIYVSYLDFDSSWTEPLRLAFCEPKRNEASISMSSDERKIYLYQDTTGNGDIFTTDFYLAKFQEIEPLDMKHVNSKDWETHCMMSHDKSRFFFVSDRLGGLGGRDIYVMERKKNGKWSKPMNLGPKINTPNDEDSPFISVDNRTLYYASNSEKSMGGFDIFKSEMLEDSTWVEGDNLGYPFNSTNDDIFYTTTLDGRRGYMTSYRKEGKGEKDIYEIYNDYLGVKDLAVLKGLIQTSDGRPIPEDFAINVKLVCLDCDEPETRLIYPRLRDGVFMTGLKPCKKYRLEFMNTTDSSSLGSDDFTTLCDVNYQEIYRELILDVDNNTVIFPEDSIGVPDLVEHECEPMEFMHYFAYNKNQLSTRRGELKKFVDGIETQIKEGCEGFTINVYSSASHVPTQTYVSNERLTKLRAENMKRTLERHFDRIEETKGKVKVVIVTTLVQGPEYKEDFRNKEKYKQYQYVGLRTE